MDAFLDLLHVRKVFPVLRVSMKSCNLAVKVSVVVLSQASWGRYVNSGGPELVEIKFCLDTST